MKKFSMAAMCARAARTKIDMMPTRLQGTQKNEKVMGKRTISAPQLRNTTYVYPPGSRAVSKPE